LAPELNGSPTVREAYRAAILGARPDLAEAPMTLHTEGWDSEAVEAGDYLFKFPKTATAADRLRREARYLKLIRPRVPLRVPDLVIHETPRVFSEHRMIPGGMLESPQYQVLAAGQRDLMAAELARFYAALHAIPPAEAEAAGALRIPDWPTADKVLPTADAMLPASLHDWSRRVFEAFAARPPDDDIAGYFDGHGWNMAFDHEHGVLNGVYDFADGGIGPRHREFCYANFVSPDLGERIMVHYEALTGRALNRRTVALYSAVQRLSELDQSEKEPEWFIAGVVGWHDHMAADPALRV
jgi:aminoglycoside phosphotransferase (APT) family kinase protein